MSLGLGLTPTPTPNPTQVALLAADNDPPQVSVNAHYPRGADRFNQGSQVRSLVITPGH